MARKPVQSRTEAPSAASQTATPAAPDVPVKTSTSVLVKATKRPLYDPYAKVYIQVFEPREYAEISGWLQCQIDAGVAEIV